MRPNLKYAAFFLCAAFLTTGCSAPTELLLSYTKAVIFDKNNKINVISDQSSVDSKNIKVSSSGISFAIHKVHSEPSSFIVENSRGSTGIWVTPAGETLRITDQGRLVGSVGTLFADWSNVTTTSISSWRNILNALEKRQFVTYVRNRDFDPGGYAGIQEKISVVNIDDYSAINVVGASPENIYWFVERSELIDSVDRIKRLKKFPSDEMERLEGLPDAIFAVSFENDKNGKVIYSKQCLSKKICFEFIYQ